MATSVPPVAGVPAPPAGSPPPGGWGTAPDGRPAITIAEPHTGYPAAQVPPAPQPSTPPAGAPPAGQPPAAPAPVALAPNTILDGPGIPPELRGKTFSEVMGIYGGMRQVVLRAAEGGAPVGAPPAADRGTPPAPPAGAPPAAGVPGAPTKEDFWRNPIEAIEKALLPKIDERIRAATEPFVAASAGAAIQAVGQQVAAEFPDFAAYEPAIKNMLAGATPEQLQNAELWRTAYWVSKGRATTGQPAAPAAPAASPAPPTGSTPYPPQPVVGPGAQPVPNMAGFFTEAPSAPNTGTGAAALTPAQLAVASAMNMSPEQYVSWKGGVAAK